MESDKTLELRDASGKVVGYFVPAQAYAELRDGYEEFRQRLRSSVPVATEEQEEEFRRQLATEPLIDGEEAISALIRELRGENGKP